MSAVNLSKLLTSEEIEQQLNNPDRIVAVISNYGKSTGKCVLHSPSHNEVKQLNQSHQILGRITLKEFKELFPNEYLCCNICGSQQGLRYNKEADRVC